MLRTASRFGVQTLSQRRACLPTCVRRIATIRSQTESVEVPVGGGGNVQLDITYPTRRDQARPSILVHLPSSGSVLSPRDNNPHSEVVQALVSSSFPSATLISVKYRLGLHSKVSAASDKERPEEYRFPQPIHDTSIGFAHIFDEILPSLFPIPQGTSPTWEPHREPRIALFGSHIGAALATVLALTNPNDIRSVAIANPIVDWVILDELLRATQSPPIPARGKRSLPVGSTEDPVAIASAAKQLIDVRTKLFASPSAYFDPFASPTLFLRAPGRDTPRTHAEALGMLDDETSFHDEAEVDDGWEAIGGKGEYAQGPPGRTPKVSSGNELGDLNVDPNVHRTKETGTKPSSLQQDLDTITEAIGADSFGPYDDDHLSKSSASTPASNDIILSTQPAALSSNVRSKQPKRRKVLRRWPPISRPEDVMLPYFNVFVSPPPSMSQPFSTEKGADAGVDALLRMQGIELVDLLRRACFYGREKGIGEERVTLTEFDNAVEGKDGNPRQSDVQRAGFEEERTRAMVEWLRWRLESP